MNSMQVLMQVLSSLIKPRFSSADVFLGIGASAAILATIVTQRFDVMQTQLDAAAFQNRLPDVQIAVEKRVSNSTAYRQQYDFSVDRFSHNIPVWQQALAGFRGKANVQYLEIGVYEGGSVVWMLENVLTDPTAGVTAIDVFDGPYKDKYFANIDRTGMAKKVTSITNFSQRALRELRPDSYDIICMDGSRAKQDVLEDAILSWRLLKAGGILIFDDYRSADSFVKGTSDKPRDFPKTAVVAFAQCFGDHLDVVHNSCQILLRKKAKGST